MPSSNALTLVNEGDVGISSDGQALIDKGLFRVVADAVMGIGVRRGCAVSINGAGTIGVGGAAIAVAAGTIVDEDGFDVAVAATTLDVTTRDVLTDRVDLVVVDTATGVASIIDGTELADYVVDVSGPEWPTIPGSRVVLGGLWVEDSTTTAGALVTADITDLRVYISNHANRVNLLSPGTGVTGDGSTADAAAIATAFSAAGAWWVPAATYIMSTLCNPNCVAAIDVECSPDAIFQASSLDAVMFEWDTAASLTGPVEFKFTGGIVNTAGQTNATGGNMGKSNVGLLNIGTKAVVDAFSFRDESWSKITIDGVKFFTKTGAHLVDPASLSQHWMGDVANQYVSGGDSAIFANCGPGPVTIQNCVFVGFRDSPIYLSGAGASGGPSDVQVLNNSFFWCVQTIAIKAGIQSGLVDGNILHDCYVGIQLVPNSNGTGPSDITVSNNTVTGYQNAFICKESTRCSFVNNRALDGGYVDWNGDAYAARGSVTLTGGASGSVSSIKVNAVELLSATVNFNTDLQTTADDIAANINANTTTPNYLASVIEDSTAGDFRVQLMSATANTDAVGFTVVSTAATITTTDETMVRSFVDPLAMDIYGSVSTEVRGLTVDGTSTAWDTDLPSRPRVVPLRIRSIDTAARTFAGADILTVDTRIYDLYIDGAASLGGEVASASVIDPDRTKVSGLMTGDDLDSYAGFTLLGASSFCHYNDEQTHIMTADQSLATDNNLYNVTGFAWPIKKDATYEISGVLLAGSDSDTADMKFKWTGVGASDGGGWIASGPNQGASSYAGRGIDQTLKAWNSAYNGLGLLAALDIVVPVFGVLVTNATVTLQFQFARRTAAGTDTVTLFAGSKVTLRRIG